MTETPRESRKAIDLKTSEEQGEAQPGILPGSFGSRRAAGVLMLLGAIGTVECSIVGRFALGLSEDSGAASFEAYRQHPLPIFLTYAGGMVAGVLLIMAAPMLDSLRSDARFTRLRVAAICQALAGLLLTLSASRWLIVLPFLQKQYDLPGATAATRAAIEVDYDTISYFLGITLGEHLFAILTGVWVILVAIHLLRTRIDKRWLGWLGIVAGFGWLLGSLEQLDFSQSQYFIVFLAGGPIMWLIWTACLARELTRKT